MQEEIDELNKHKDRTIHFLKKEYDRNYHMQNVEHEQQHEHLKMRHEINVKKLENEYALNAESNLQQEISKHKKNHLTIQETFSKITRKWGVAKR